MIERGGSRSGIHYSVSWLAHFVQPGVFSWLPLPGRRTMRVMDKGVHLAALEAAGRKLVELRTKSGKRERSA